MSLPGFRSKRIQQIHSDLSKLFSRESLGHLTCTRWAREFANGKEAAEDDHRSGAPKSLRKENTVESIRQQLIRIHILLYERLVQTLVYSMALFKQYYWKI